MSDAKQRQVAKNEKGPKPAASRGKNAQPRTAKRSPRRKKQAAVPIRIEPADAERPGATLSEKLKDEARTGLPGMAVSAGVHLLVLVLMWLVVVAPYQKEKDPAMEFGWFSSAVASSSENPNQPLDNPLQDNRPTPNGPPSENANTKKKTESTSPNRSVGVSPADVKNILNGRNRDKRGIMLEKYGGGEATERAVNRGLMWLKRHQRAAGNWSLHEGYPNAGSSTIRTKTGATALALLAFLGTGHTHQYGDHPDTVRRGLKWLTGIQQLDGNYFDFEGNRPEKFYAHSLATIVVCEAYAMTRDENLRESAEAGVGFLIRTQQPINGGWKYMPQTKDTVADLSVTGWALMALHTARVAGLDVPPNVFELSANFLDTVQEQNGARYKYEPSNSPGEVTVARTAVGLLGRQFLGWPAGYPAMEQGIDFITQPRNSPQWTGGRRNVYEWYYVGHVLHNAGGEKWRHWYEAAQKAIVPNQVHSGSNKGPSDVRGSWHPTQPLGSPHEYAGKAGRLYMTAMCILILEMPYRHLPIYEE